MEAERVISPKTLFGEEFSVNWRLSINFLAAANRLMFGISFLLVFINPEILPRNWLTHGFWLMSVFVRLVVVIISLYAGYFPNREFSDFLSEIFWGSLAGIAVSLLFRQWVHSPVDFVFLFYFISQFFLGAFYQFFLGVSFYRYLPQEDFLPVFLAKFSGQTFSPEEVCRVRKLLRKQHLSFLFCLPWRRGFLVLIRPQESFILPPDFVDLVYFPLSLGKR